jgi:hypothetical protein
MPQSITIVAKPSSPNTDSYSNLDLKMKGIYIQDTWTRAEVQEYFINFSGSN